MVDLPEGQDLAAEIAAKVKGWCREILYCPDIRGYRDYWCENGCKVCYCSSWRPDVHCDEFFLDVARQLREEGWNIHVDCPSNALVAVTVSRGMVVSVKLSEIPTDDIGLNRAIATAGCRAALEAVTTSDR